VRERDAVGAMVKFCKEVIRMKDLQSTPYIPWIQRIAESTEEPKPFTGKAFERRYNKLNDVVVCIEAVLGKELPILNKMKSDFQHCVRSLNALRSLSNKLNYYRSMISSPSDDQQGLFGRPTDANDDQNNEDSPRKDCDNDTLRKESDDGAAPEFERNVSPLQLVSWLFALISCIQVERSRSSSDKFSPEMALSEALAKAPLVADVDPAIAPYDHSQCSDCTLVYGMANECAMHLAASQHFAEEGSSRLQKLCYLREQINELVHQLEDVDLDGIHVFNHHE